jgi:hypothetical protein
MPSRCADLGGRGGLVSDGGFVGGIGSSQFHDQLDRAMRLAMEHAGPR